MLDALTHAVAWYAVAVAAFAALHTVRHTQFSNALFYGVAALELCLVALLGTAIVTVLRTDHHMQAVLYFSYWSVTLIVAPAAVVWGIADKSRWGSGVVVVGMLTVGALLVRLVQIWQGS
jgi:hypothetical protein